MNERHLQAASPQPMGQGHDTSGDLLGRSETFVPRVERGPGTAIRRRPVGRRTRGDARVAQASALSDSLDSLRHTVRFLQDLMRSRQAQAERAKAGTIAELADLRQRIRWIEQLARTDR